MKKRLLFLRDGTAGTVLVAYLFIAGLVLLPTRWLGELVGARGDTAEYLGIGLMRLLLCGVLLFLMYHMDIRKRFLPRGAIALLASLPALVIAVNNLPILSLAAGTTRLTASPQAVAAFALQCVGVGLFEEIAFRGILFPYILGMTGTDVRGRFAAVLVSGGLFGALHLVNLLGGFSGGVFLQVGYSFLLGCMLAVCVFCGAGVLVCALVHAVYNFCGNVVWECGNGTFSLIWTPAEIALTVVVSLAVAAFYVLFLYKSRPAAGVALEKLFPQDGESGEGEDGKGGES